jgi:IS5 family transposase
MVQKSLFSGTFMEMLDTNDLFIVLANNYPWSKLEDYLSQFYSGIGRPPKPIRLMVGLLLLKQMENLSDDEVPLEGRI